MKILILDDDYNLILEAFAAEKTISIQEIDDYAENNPNWAKMNAPIRLKYNYVMAIPLIEFPHEKIVYRLYNPAKDVS